MTCLILNSRLVQGIVPVFREMIDHALVPHQNGDDGPGNSFPDAFGPGDPYGSLQIPWASILFVLGIGWLKDCHRTNPCSLYIEEGGYPQGNRCGMVIGILRIRYRCSNR